MTASANDLMLRFLPHSPGILTDLVDLSVQLNYARLVSKSHVLQIRITDAQKSALDRAAAHEALETSTWVRSVALKAAAATLRIEVEKLVSREKGRAIK
jgi:hypothetical protein